MPPHGDSRAAPAVPAVWQRSARAWRWWRRGLAATKVTVPILAMGSESVFGPGVADSFRQVATDVREVVAPDTGHWIPEENPRFLLDCAEPFFWPGTAPPAPSGDLAGCAH